MTVEALTEDQIVAIRRFIGDEPVDADLQPMYVRYENLKGVVLEVLQTRRANLLASPLQFSVVGEYGQNARWNVEYLTDLIDKIQSGAIDPDAPASDIATSAFLVRLNPPDPILR